MKRLLIFLFFTLSSFQLVAQVPQKMGYQAVVRNSAQKLVVNTYVSVRVSILKESVNGVTVYSETHTKMTNANGLVTLIIGEGNVITGVFPEIDWAVGPYFVKVETDPSNGTNFLIQGSSQLLSVPYAFYAGNVENALPKNGTQNQTLSWCNGKPKWGACTPTLTTNEISVITSTGATVSSTVKDDAGNPVTARGIVWSTSPSPTIDLTSKTNNGAGIGNFVSEMISLVPVTRYYVRSYAVNSAGITYGNEISFTTASTNPNSMIDIDGNQYPIIKICDQIWMAKNLNVSTYRNGDPIPQVTDGAQWEGLTTGAWCYYENVTSNGTTYGKLYNWYAVNDPRGLAPAGWHIPSDLDWTTLSICLGGDAVAGAKIKSVGTDLWSAPNAGATNSSGFSGLPAGYRMESDGAFLNIKQMGYWWSSTEVGTFDANTYSVIYSGANLFSNYFSRKGGFSVRCIKN